MRRADRGKCGSVIRTRTVFDFEEEGDCNPFGLTIEELGAGTVRVAMRGELDLSRAYSFDEEMRRLELRKPAVIVLDLRDLTFLDSAGLARVLALHRRARRDGWRLLVVRGSRAVQRLLALTAVDTRLEMISHPAAALALP